MNYELGLQRFRELLKKKIYISEFDKNREMNAFLVYEARLLEKIAFQNLYGVLTNDGQIEKTVIISHLNDLARTSEIGCSFNDLCQ